VQIPSESGDLTAVVASMVFPVAGILNYVPPSGDQKTAFRSALNALLNGDETGALQEFQNLDLKITRFSDVSGETFFLIRETGPTPRGWGLYAINQDATRKVILEAPHPIADQATETEAASFFLSLSARALLIGGAHRCASPDLSSCDGTTTVCSTSSADESFRISDAAHSEEQVFEIVHEEILSTDGSLTTVALHGFDQQTGDPHAFVSNGTTSTAISSVSANRFVSLLKTATGVANAAQSCNDGSAGARLCGTDDLQGRFTNGSSDACTTASTAATQRFLHIEQSLDLRNDGGAGDPLTPSAVLDVLTQLF